MRPRGTALILGFAILAAEPSAAQQAPPVSDLIQRASDYVVRFVDTLSNVVAEERYEQVVPASARSRNVQRRQTRSDFLLVRPALEERWVQFRDVFEVDGQPVRRTANVVALLGSRNESDFERGRRLAGESARFNIGVRRTFNLPLLALGFLQPAEVGRFVYDVEHADPLLGPDVWVVKFRERAEPSVVRDTDGRNLMTEGRLWISSRTGRVWKTEWRIDFAITAIITTEFTSDSDFAVLVPRRMNERYLRLGSVELNGNASYGRFRRFGVQTEESLRK